MTTQDDTSSDVLQSVWTVDHDHSGLDEDCSPTKPCRNMRVVTFDGFAESGGDVAAAWRKQLEREGKLDKSGGSLRDLVLGSSQ